MQTIWNDPAGFSLGVEANYDLRHIHNDCNVWNVWNNWNELLSMELTLKI